MLGAALLIGALLASRGITDENAVSLQGDVPRYLMNGTFLFDFLASGRWTPSEAMTFAEHYYARYPALSIGHHPPLLPILLLPFYAVFGISVFSGKLAIVACFLLTIALLFVLARRMYDGEIAGWSCLLFATTPLAAEFSQQVLSEMPTILLTTAAIICLLKFRESGRSRDYLGFVGAAAASLFCRQTAAYMVPAYTVLMLRQGGTSQLRQPLVLATTTLGIVAAVGAAVATLVLSPFNAWVVGRVLRDGFQWSMWMSALASVVHDYSSPWLFLIGAAGLIAAAWRRDSRIAPAAWWTLSVFVCVVVVTGPIAPVRYSVIALPALAIMAASVAAHATSRRTHLLMSCLLVAVVVSQFDTTRRIRPVGASGYEAAAEFVLSEAPYSTVMYSASVDTGYFAFFVRKHDPAQRLVVLRSDKILTTSLMAELSVEDRISRPEDIYTLLDQFGTRFVVLEDRPSGSEVIEWLREAAQSNRFSERRRFQTNSRDPRLRGVALVVYEYLDHGPPAPDAQLDMRLPLVGREIHVPLRDLLRVPSAPPGSLPPARRP